MCIGLQVKKPFFCRIVMNLEISRLILKNNLMSNFVKICDLGAELFHADGRTDG